MHLDDTEPTPEGPRPTATDRAAQMGERLVEATTRIGNAFADAYQEAVLTVADVRGKLGPTSSIDWRAFTPQAAQAGARAQAKPLREVTATATRVHDQLVDATKQLGLTYVDACEELALCAVELREQAAAASDNTLMRSSETARAGVARDVTRAYAEAARRLLG